MKAKHFLFVALAALTMTVFNACSLSEMKIKKAVEQANKECPIFAAVGMEITSVEFDGKYVIYNTEYDNSMYTITDDLYDVLKDALVAELQRQAIMDKSVKDLLKSLKDADAGIIYRYYCDTETHDIVLESYDL